MCYSSVPPSAGRFFQFLQMTVLDILLAIPMGWLIFRGWKKGLVREVATLAGVLVGIWAAVHMSQWVIELLGLEGENAVIIAFFVAFVGALVLTYLLGRGVEQLLKTAKMSIINRVAGAALGFLKALCILAVLLSNIVILDHTERLITPKMKEESLLYKPVYDVGGRLTDSLKQYICEHHEEWKQVVITKDKEEVE